MQKFLTLLNSQDKFQKVSHKEDMVIFNAKFLIDTKNVVYKFHQNPFLAEQFQKLNSPIIFPGKVPS